MNLHIVLDSKSDQLIQSNEPSLFPETISIAGKELLVYWIEWAHYKGYDTLYIYTQRNVTSPTKVKMLQDLYGIRIIYLPLSEIKNENITQNIFTGIGIFLDTGEYKVFQSLFEILLFEQELIFNPFDYCSLSGYGKHDSIQVGKDVYIHKSVKLSGTVIIGDNCILEKGVEINNSVVNAGSLIKSNSVIKNSHISKNLKMLTTLYLKGKALFTSTIYSIEDNSCVAHSGICTQN